MLATMLMSCLIWAKCAHAVLPPASDSCLRNVIAERQKLKSGQCVLRGKRTPIPIAADVEMIEDFEISATFDAGRIRMDSAEPGYVVAANQALKMEMVERKFYRTSTQSAMWIVGTDNLFVDKPDAKRKVHRFMEFDPRALGMYTEISFRGAMPLNEMFSGYLKRPPSEVDIVASDQDLVRISISSETKRRVHQIEYWIAPKEGFSVRKIERRERQKASPEVQWNVIERNTAEWSQIDGVWVPITCHMVNFNGATIINELTCEIQWNAINEPLKDSLFYWKSFGAPPNVVVHDSR